MTCDRKGAAGSQSNLSCKIYRRPEELTEQIFYHDLLRAGPHDPVKC